MFYVDQFTTFSLNVLSLGCFGIVVYNGRGLVGVTTIHLYSSLKLVKVLHLEDLRKKSSCQ